jgi:hypothetical protein
VTRACAACQRGSVLWLAGGRTGALSIERPQVVIMAVTGEQWSSGPPHVKYRIEFVKWLRAEGRGNVGVMHSHPIGQGWLQQPAAQDSVDAKQCRSCLARLSPRGDGQHARRLLRKAPSTSRFVPADSVVAFPH